MKTETTTLYAELLRASAQLQTAHAVARRTGHDEIADEIAKHGMGIAALVAKVLRGANARAS